jgi:hypothetical protein
MNVLTQPFRPIQTHTPLDSQEEAEEHLLLPPQSNNPTQIEYLIALKDLVRIKESSHQILPNPFQVISPK